MVFSVELDYFFTDPRKRYIVAVVRRNERKVFPSDPKSARVPWHFESLDFRVNGRKLSGYLAHFIRCRRKRSHRTITREWNCST